MTEVRALVVTFVGFLVLMAATLLALIVANASDAVLTLAFVVVLLAGAHVVSQVVMHYGSSTRQRRR
jgi:hypothetical protein